MRFRRKEDGSNRRPNSSRRREQPPGEGYRPKDPPQTIQNTIPREIRAISSVRVGEDTDYPHADFPEAQITESSNLDIMDNDYSTRFLTNMDSQKETDHLTLTRSMSNMEGIISEK